MINAYFKSSFDTILYLIHLLHFIFYIFGRLNVALNISFLLIDRADLLVYRIVTVYVQLDHYRARQGNSDCLLKLKCDIITFNKNCKPPCYRPQPIEHISS